MSGKKQVPIEEGLFVLPLSPGEAAHLIGQRCNACAEVMFEKRRFCPNCQSEDLQEIALSRRGKLWSYTRLEYPSLPPYKAPDPYIPLIVGLVELPEGIAVLSLLTDCDFDKLEIGMDMELLIEPDFEDDDGNDVLVYKFRPIDSQ